MVVFELWSSVQLCIFCLLQGSQQQAQQTEMGAGGVPKGAKTSDYYRTNDIPERFNNPGNFK